MIDAIKLTNLQERIDNLKTKFVKLTDNGLLFEDTQKTEMMNKFQLRLGMSNDDIQKIISAI